MRIVIILALAAAPDHYIREREAMVQQLSREGIRDARVLAAIRAVPRHLFVPEDYRASAYADTALPIGLGQTISQPYIVAAMTEMLSAGAGDRVLEIGTGSGYQAAVLSRLASEVYSIELEPKLARSASARLRTLGYRNVIVKEDDGYQGWAEKAPFDRIIVTAAPPSVPGALMDQLKRGGKLVAPVGTGDQWLQVIEKTSDGRVKTRNALPVKFVPMRPGR